MTIEEFKRISMEKQLNIVNGVRNKTDQFKELTGCEFNYSTATDILLSEGCVSVGKCMWQPPMFTRDEKDQLMSFLRNASTADASIKLTPIKASAHTSVRLSAETKEAWDSFCSERALISPAVLMDAALRSFMNAVETGTLNLKV